jgi:FAD/FMN-containing dehydrogenase
MRADFEAKRARLAEALRSAGTKPVRLRKRTSNLFRDRKPSDGLHLDVGDLTGVLDVDLAAGLVDVEAMTTYADLVDACLAVGVMPAVVPELKSITIGGAVSGLGIEASSFRHGLVHETVTELEVLLPDGRSVVATPTNADAPLFFGIPNAFGTLGYILRLKAKTVPVQPYVRIERTRHGAAEAFLADLAEQCQGDADFVEGVVFAADRLYVSVGRFVDRAPFVSDYSFEHVYYRSIAERPVDYLTVRDFIWRWDTDWFWCSKNLLAEWPPVRRLLGRDRLNSITYTRLMRWNNRFNVLGGIHRLLGRRSESVIQDVDVPIDRAAEFLDFLLREIGIVPVWTCPFRTRPGAETFPLFPLPAGRLYVNFGFWDIVRSRERRPANHYNRLIERKLIEIGGTKSLYSDSYFSREEFWRLYNGEAYGRLKAAYDPDGRLKDLYQKCVLRE